MRAPTHTAPAPATTTRAPAPAAATPTSTSTATPPGTKGRREIDTGSTLKLLTWNTCGFPAQTMLELQDEVAAGAYDAVLLQETRGAEQIRRTDQTIDAAARLYTGEEPPDGDPASGVAMLLSPRLHSRVVASGAVGSRIVWVRIKMKKGHAYIVSTYIPHSQRSEPSREDTLKELETFLLQVPPADMCFCGGDLNSKLAQAQRGQGGAVGSWCVHARPDKGGEVLADILERTGMHAASTFFRPERRRKSRGRGWSRASRLSTYMAKDPKYNESQIDYWLVSNRYKSSVRNCRTVWRQTIRRHGRKFDHAAIEMTIDVRLSAPKRRTPKYDYSWLTDRAGDEDGPSNVDKFNERLCEIIDKKNAEKVGGKPAASGTLGTTRALPTLTTPPEPPRNHGNPGEIDNIDDVDNIENFNDEDECESYENDYENDGAKNFEGAAGQKLKAGGKPATSGTLAPAPKTPLAQRQSTGAGAQPVSSWRRPTDTHGRPPRRGVQTGSTLRALSTLPTAPEPPRNHGNPGEIDDTENFTNFTNEDGCKSHENGEVQDIINDGEACQNGEINDTNNTNNFDDDGVSEDCPEGQDEVGAPGKNFECAVGQNDDDGAPGKNLDLHNPNKLDVNALHEDMTAATREATEELVPKAPRRVQRGRKASATTEGFREQRTKSMSTKKNRNHPEVVAINNNINKSCRQDCRDWVDGVAAEMQTASDKNDSKKVWPARWALE